jgi:hypothetical protein
MFNSKLAALLIAGLATVALATQTGAAHAAVVYDLTLTATSGLTGLNQVSSYFQAPQNGSGTLLDLTITLGGDTFTLAQKNNGSNPLVQFTSGGLDDVTYAGVAANGDSLQMTSGFVFFTVQNRIQEFGTFSAGLDVAPAVPEPSTWAMMIFGFCGLGFNRRKNAPTFRLA